MKKVLIVEDDTFLQNLEAKKFANAGFEVLHAATQKEFNAELAKNPDIAVLDILLPDADGIALLETIRKNPATATIPIIMFSNMGDTSYIERAKNLGATDFMIKAQFTLDEIAARITELLK